VLKDASTYEIMKPEMVGLKQSSLVLGSIPAVMRSCTSWRRWATSSAPTRSKDAFVRMKALADRKKDIYDEDTRRWSTRRWRPPRPASSWRR